MLLLTHQSKHKQPALLRFVENSEANKDFDYSKTKSHFEFEIKSGQEAEALRILADKVEKYLHDEVVSLKIENGSAEDLFAFVEGLMLANYRFLAHFSKPKSGIFAEVVVPKTLDKNKIQELTNIAKAVFKTRDLVNTPVSHLNAEQLAQAVVELGAEAGFQVQVLEETQIETLKMGGLLAVNKGSIDPPTFTVAEYKPKNAKNKQPVVLVGKGVVYDTGGLSLKPTPGSMDTMKGDMAGAATMAAVIYLAALEKLPVHLIALLPATDNRPGGNAYAPGDVITMFDGTTVEVLNTDAEGRMILADALAYSNKYNPELVIDAATLTGAALRAIGTEASIIMGNAKDEVFERLEASGNTVHERVVRFPFWDDYKKHMKSKIADLKNIGGPNAGMISAGKFLEHFVKAPYIHMDIAGPAWLDAPENYKGEGGTGAGVRLLYHFIKSLHN
ncbi:MAG: leucyl aminopeptidase family protein [Flavobacteriales bacterium]